MNLLQEIDDDLDLDDMMQAAQRASKGLEPEFEDPEDHLRVAKAIRKLARYYSLVVKVNPMRRSTRLFYKIVAMPPRDEIPDHDEYDRGLNDQMRERILKFLEEVVDLAEIHGARASHDRVGSGGGPMYTFYTGVWISVPEATQEAIRFVFSWNHDTPGHTYVPEPVTLVVTGTVEETNKVRSVFNHLTPPWHPTPTGRQHKEAAKNFLKSRIAPLVHTNLENLERASFTRFKHGQLSREAREGDIVKITAAKFLRAVSL